MLEKGKVRRRKVGGEGEGGDAGCDDLENGEVDGLGKDSWGERGQVERS